MLGKLHGALVFNRRIRVLARHIADRLPQNARVLDIGCGSGDLALLIMRMRPDVSIEGIDVLVRDDTAIPVIAFDGSRIPHPDSAFDASIIVDVLHHSDDPAHLLGEAARVAPVLIVKDHLRDGFAAGLTLRFMDWVGNVAHGVRLPYNYLSEREWTGIFAARALTPGQLATSLGLYPWPFGWLFDRRLHFVATLKR